MRCSRKATLSEVKFLKEIRYSRKKQGLSQEQLAKMSGLSRYTIMNFESGKRDPRIKDLRKIAKALNVSIEELISENETDGSN